MVKNIQKCLCLVLMGALFSFWLPIQSFAQTASSAAVAKPLSSDTLFSLVNTHRTSIKLPAFEKTPYLCELAKSRAPEIYNEIFVTGRMHQGLFSRIIPFWITENIISMQTEEKALSWWLNSPVHRSAIQGDYKYSCTACSGNSCAEVFSNLTPKASISARLISTIK